MNFKFLFPTYLNRFLFVKNVLNQAEGMGDEKILHVGTGEGDYDPMISKYCSSLIACDHNQEDLDFARRRNLDIEHLEYRIEDALNLSFPENIFDKVIAVEVIEHVINEEVMLSNIYRVLKPGGIAILTFPSRDFPITYDPVNRLLSFISDRHLPMGAFAFGHDHLISSAQFIQWSKKCGFQVLKEEPLSGYLVGLLEMYWTGVVQQIFKWNALNKSRAHSKVFATRPGKKTPALTAFVETLTRWDARYFSRTGKSIGKGFVIQKIKSNQNLSTETMV